MHCALDERMGAAEARLGATARMLQRGCGSAADVPEREPDESSSPPRLALRFRRAHGSSSGKPALGVGATPAGAIDNREHKRPPRCRRPGQQPGT